MKYIFVVHSNITYLAALGVICEKKLLMEDVFIISDMYRQTEPVKCHYIDIRMPIRNLFIHPSRVLRPFKYVDDVIKKLIGSSVYTLYVTVFFNLQRICVTNPLCERFHFIEEGMSNYCESIPLSLSLSYIYEYRSWRNNSIRSFFSDALMLIKGYNAKIQALPFLYNAYFNTTGVEFFGFDKHSFIGVKNVNVMDMKQISLRFRFKPQYKFVDANIWLGTNVVTVGSQKLDDYISAITNGCLKELKQRSIKQIYIKFHPTECLMSRQATKQLFEKHNFETTILADSLVLEIELQNAISTTIWGVDSSLMFYAAKLGVFCNSIIEFLVDYPIFNTSVYWNMVHKIPKK